MGWFDFGNPPIHSTTVQPVANPTTATLVQELDSTQLRTVNFSAQQTGLFRVNWICGGDTNATWQLEQANSTALSASTNVITVRTPTNQSAQYVAAYVLAKDDRLRIRLQTSLTANVMAYMQAERLT